MEEEDLGMNLFDDNFEFNFDDLPQGFESDEDDENTSDEDITKDIKAVEDEDPEEVDSEDDQDEGSDEDDESGDSSSNIYSSLATFIHEQGLLPSLDIEKTEIKTAEEFADALKNEVTTQSRILAEDYLSKLDIEAIARSQAEIKDLENIDEEYLKSNIEAAKQIIYQDYLNQGLDEKKAGRLLSRLVDLGEDAIIEDALESTSSLKEFNSRKIQEQKDAYEENVRLEKEANEKSEKVLKETIFDRKDLINGYTPTKAIQDKVYKSINEIVGKSPVDGSFENKFMKERRENPIDFEARMYYFYELTNGFKDYNKVATSAKSKAINDLEAIVKKGAYKDSGTPAWMSDKNSYDIGIGDELNL